MPTVKAQHAKIYYEACGPENATSHFIDIGDLLPPKLPDASNSMAAQAADLDGDGDEFAVTDKTQIS